MIFKLTSDYVISCFYCIIQFGLEKNIRKGRGCFREHVRGEKKGGEIQQQKIYIKKSAK